MTATPSDTDIVQRVIAAIVEAKTLTGMTTVDLAAAYTAAAPPDEALQPTTLNNLLAGKRNRIGVAELIRFCAVLQLDPLDIVPELASTDPETTRRKYRREFEAQLKEWINA